MDIKQARETLTAQSQKLQNSINEGINWLKNNVEDDRKYVSEMNLKNHRRHLRRYMRAIPKRPAIAIFGQSQVGKSYLVSNLTKRPEDFSLFVKIPGTNEKIDFIANINPPGGGKEATGLVSRFTTADNWQQGWKPFELVLFSQADVVKVIANGYLSDITHYTYTINHEKIQEKLNELFALRTNELQPGFTEDEIFDIKEYLNDKFPDHFIIKDLNNINFWEDIARIVPFIAPSLRWQIFEFLWGLQPFFTDLFKKLTDGLQTLGFRESVRCDIDALTPQADTILDVERLRELYKENEKSIVELFDGNEKIAELDKSTLSAITAEVILPLADETAQHPGRQFLNSADVLDFPGARSRQQIPEDTFEDKPEDDKLFVFLRGKVAFLFHRYNYNFEISTLLFCMDDRQPEVTDLPKFLYEWIRDTHGESPQKREEREKKLARLVPNAQIDRIIPLLVVLTKFNIELAGNPATEKPGLLEPHNAKWTKRIRANFAEFMSISLSDDWINNWNSKGAFKNIFPLRDPKWSEGIYDGFKEFGKETSVRPEYAEKLKDMEKSWLSHPDVLKHFHNPQEAWKEVTDLNKDGLDYIIKYLTPTCNPIIKHEQIKSQISSLKTKVISELSIYYQGGTIDEKLRKARTNAAKVFMMLLKMQKEKNTFGHFIDKLTISDVHAWKIYFDMMMREQIDTEEEQDNSFEEKTVPLDLIEMLSQFIEITPEDTASTIIAKLKEYFAIDDDDTLTSLLKESGIDIEDLMEAEKQPQKPKEKYDKAYIFAQKLISRWLQEMEQIKDDRISYALGLPKDIAELIINELNKAKNRVNLKKTIADKTREHIKTFQLTSNVDIVARISATMINDFVNTAGWKYEPPEKRPKVKSTDKLPVFTETAVITPEKEDLKLGLEFPGEEFFVQWTAAIRNNFEANVYYEENVRDEKQAQADAQLGNILKKTEEIVF